MTAHANLTGADLHEPKGAATASANQVYVANGSGSGAWKTLQAASIDTSSIKNVNKFNLCVTVRDIANPSNTLVPIPFNCTLTKATGVLNGAITTADSTVAITNNGSASVGTFTIAYGSSAEGVQYLLSSPVNNSLTAGTYLKIACDGGGTSTGAVDFTLFLEFSYT